MLLGLAACGGDDSDTASDEPSVSESESTDEEDAADAPAEGEVVDNAEFVDEMMAGLEASTTANMTMDMDFGGGTLSAEGKVDYTTDPVEHGDDDEPGRRWARSRSRCGSSTASCT